MPREQATVHGNDLFPVAKELGWLGLLIYSVTGRKPGPEQISLVSMIWAISTSYPDPRIWNNRIGTLAGVAPSTGVLGVGAGIVVYGQQPLLGAANLMLKVKKQLDKGQALEKILIDRYTRRDKKARPAKGKRREIASIPGYGKPIPAETNAFCR